MLFPFIYQNELTNYLRKADEIYLSFGAPKEALGQSSDKTEALYQEAKLAGLKFIPMEIRHLGTENCVPLLKKIRNALKDKVDIFFETPVKEILVEGGKASGALRQ